MSISLRVGAASRPPSLLFSGSLYNSAGVGRTVAGWGFVVRSDGRADFLRASMKRLRAVFPGDMEGRRLARLVAFLFCAMVMWFPMNCAISKPASAEALPPFSPTSTAFAAVDRYAVFFIDDDGKRAFQEIEQISSNRFRPLQDLPYAGFSTKVIWVRLSIDMKDFPDSFFYLQQAYTAIGGITLFYSEGDKLYELKLDEKLRSHGRILWSPDFVFRLPKPASNIGTYYIKYEPRGHLLDIKLAFAGEDGEYLHAGVTQLSNGLFFGALFVMLIYNAFLFVFVRHIIYFYYCYYLLGFVGVYTYLNGFVSLIVGSTSGFQSVFVVGMYGAVHGCTLFSRSFLGLKEALPRLDAISKLVQWLLVFGAACVPFFPIGLSWKLACCAIVVQAPILLLSGGIRWWQGYKPAKWFCIGWALLALSDIKYNFEVLGFIPESLNAAYFIEAGAVWEAVVFSLSLGYRIKLADAEAATQRENALDAKRKAADIAELAVRERGTLLGMVSHELKSPLQSIVSALDILELRIKDRESTEFVRKIRRASLALSAQLRDILALAQTENDRLELIPELFDANELVRDVNSPHRESAQKKGLEFNEILPADSPHVVGDQARIAQILTGLVSNAVKYTDAGHVTVTMDDFHLEDPFLRFEIRDTGNGIPLQFKSKLFTPFARFGTLQRGRDGTGLGLAIVHALLKHLNGSIEVESEEGKGTAFKVKIPVTPGERLPTTTSIGSRTGEAVVLVVDDRIDILEGIREVLGELDCRCECTDSPAVAANMLAVNKYDIVLIDLEMPMKSGSELASEIKRSLGPNRDTPLIAFSAAADARAGKTWPFVDFLSKPVSKTQLKIALDRHMSTKPT